VARPASLNRANETPSFSSLPGAPLVEGGIGRRLRCFFFSSSLSLSPAPVG